MTSPPFGGFFSSKRRTIQLIAMGKAASLSTGPQVGTEQDSIIEVIGIADACMAGLECVVAGVMQTTPSCQTASTPRQPLA
jgi:hypothetical protein